MPCGERYLAGETMWRGEGAVTVERGAQVCVCVYVCASMCVSVYVCAGCCVCSTAPRLVFFCVCVCARRRVHAHMRLPVFVCVCACACVHMCKSMCMRVQTLLFFSRCSLLFPND